MTNLRTHSRTGCRRKKEQSDSAPSSARQAKVHLYSELYCRLNGFMLGVFTEMCNFKLAKNRYPFYRNRIQTFLDEIDIDTKVPVRFEEYETWAGRADSFAPHLERRSPILRDFWMLGVFAVTYIRLAKRNRPEAESCRRLARDILTHNHLSFEPFDHLVKPEGKPARSVDEVLSPALTMLVQILQPLRPEPKTSFIAMPFRKRFEHRYPLFYRPLLANTGYRTLRAWGGFGQEDFSPLLVTLIMKSGAILADITTPNPNVIWEVGVAQGGGKIVFLVREEGRRPPADLAKHVAASYLPQGTNWPSEAVNTISLLLSIQASAIEKLGGDPIRIASGLRYADVEERTTFLKDTFWEVSFFSLRDKGKNDANEHIKRGLERARGKRWIEADADFTYALRHGGYAPAALFGRGMVRLQLWQYRAADGDFSTAISKGLDDPMVYQFRAIARFNQRKWHEAREDIDRFLASRPDNIEGLHLRARVCAQSGDLTQLEQDCRESTRLAPKYPGTNASQGFLHMLRKEFSEAAACFREARAKSLGKSWHFEAGLCELLAENFETAVGEYERGLLHATDENIDDGLFDLSFWRGKFPMVNGTLDKVAARIRRRLLQVRTPRSWSRATRQGWDADPAERKSSNTRQPGH